MSSQEFRVNLIPCDICEKPIAPTAPTCPFCGAPQEMPGEHRRLRWLILGGVLVIALGTAAGIIAANGFHSASKPAPHEVSGTLMLSLGSITGQLGNDRFAFTNGTVTVAAGGGACAGADGFEDIKSGTEVTVSNDAGKVVGAGVLAAGTVTDPGAQNAKCEFSFAIPHVADAPFYKIEIAHRGQVVFSRADVLSGNVIYTLGG